MGRSIASNVVREGIMKKKVVIFGVGYFGKRAIEIIEKNFSQNKITIIDNFNYGYTFLGHYVESAEKFLCEVYLREYDYVISGKYSYEMYMQLVAAGVKEEEIFSLESYVVKHFELNKYKMYNTEKGKENKIIIFDCSSGFVMGGVEKWTYTVGEELKKRGYDIKLYTESIENTPPDMFKDDVLLFDTKNRYKDVEEELNQFISMFEQYQNIIYVIAHCKHFSYMAMLTKRIIPEKVKVFSIIHSGLEYIAIENLLLQEYVDRYLCVNLKIKEWLWERLDNPSKVSYKETPVRAKELRRLYNTRVENAIQIGYAARLEIEHKRADLIVNLIEELEKKKCNYRIDIAGDGSCFKKIDEYVEVSNLRHKVKMLGTIEYSEMYNFWERQDVAVNVSETEGCSLSMLESMSCGCVQVLTDIPGTEIFVEQEVSGYRVERGNIELMAEKIKYLDEHRERLPEMGKKAYDKIREKCNIDKYVDFFERMIK